jgi:hypothetical protein
MESRVDSDILTVSHGNGEWENNVDKNTATEIATKDKEE